MGKFCLLFILAVSLQVDAQKNQSVDPRLQGLDAQFEQVLKDWNAAGFAVAVVEKNKVIYAKGFGFRDAENKLPVTPNTLFAIGSCTKAFTASVVGILQKEGKIDIDKPAHNYLTSLRFFNNEMSNNITLRDMMSHRTGLPRHDLSWYFFNQSPRDSLLFRVQYQEPTAKLRDRWQYNNFMYLAQGVITEKITGSSWEENVRQKIFQPLAMTSSYFSVRDMENSTDAAKGYGLKKDSFLYKLPYYNIDAMGPAGSINSNVMDMSKWITTWINGGKYESKEVIPAGYFTDAISSQIIIGPGLPSKERPDIHFATYGLGWMLSSYRGHYRVEHGGNIDGFSASTSFMPTDSIGIVVLVNQNGSSVPGIVRNMLYDRLLKLKPYNWSTEMKKEANKAKELNASVKKEATAKLSDKPTHPLEDYVGRFTNSGYGAIRVWKRNDSLYATLDNNLLWLRHDNYNVFDFFRVLPGEELDTTNSGPLRMQFFSNLRGEIDRVTLNLETGLEPLVFKRQLEAAAISSSRLQQYTGDYELGNMVIKIYVKEDKTLFALVPGQPDYELLPMGKDKFALKGLDGFFVMFEVSGDEKPGAIIFMQPNGDFKAKRKQ
jgi:CubicO group peptidase (beta-lactamase class C family)